jgi:DNA-binding CsgD family transcriptional regulator
MEINNTPPGILNNDVEFVAMNGEVKCIHGGRMYSWPEMSIRIKAKLKELLEMDPKAIRGLEAMGITDMQDQLHQFAFCNFGEFDKNADVKTNGQVHREYWNCGQRENCPGHGLVCKFPVVAEGRLTAHDVHLAVHVAEDMVNKEIADHLGVSVHTINRECKNLARKLRVKSKPGIAAFAASHLL